MWWSSPSILRRRYVKSFRRHSDRRQYQYTHSVAASYAGHHSISNIGKQCPIITVIIVPLNGNNAVTWSNCIYHDRMSWSSVAFISSEAETMPFIFTAVGHLPGPAWDKHDSLWWQMIVSIPPSLPGCARITNVIKMAARVRIILAHDAIGNPILKTACSILWTSASINKQYFIISTASSVHLKYVKP